LAGWFKVFGFSIWSQRYLSAFWGVIAILAWYVIIEALSRDYRLAVFTATLIGLDHALVASASLGRMDMMSAALSYAALAAYLALRERRLPLAFPAAFSAVAASGLSHPAGGVLSFCGVSLLAIYLDRRRVNVHCLTLAAIPFVIAAMGWGLFVLRNSGYFLSQFEFNITFHKRTSGFSSR
jgi:4-amino-4-deoxy-L-arabinose transferase-like glycosyltransferase